METKNEKQNTTTRPPVVVVMGHIDHGKSTLLDYIRKTNITDSEIGGITQRISAYEVLHKDKNEKENSTGGKITFLDTPGHEAFSKMRERGAKLADIAILIVSAEDGVKPQTIEAWKTILKMKLPVIVAINKTDKPSADIEKTKIELAENEIYLENYGGKVPCAEISAKTGTGIDDLLSLVLILAEMENLTGKKNEDASGYVMETDIDPRCGIQATLLIKEGTLKKCMTVVAEDSTCCVRMMEYSKGGCIEEASFSSPVRIFGFDRMPQIGAEFKSFQNKKDASKCAEDFRCDDQNRKSPKEKGAAEEETKEKIIQIIIRADVSGTLEAIEREMTKIKNEAETSGVVFRITTKGVGPISESDIKNITYPENAIVIGFNVKADKNAAILAQKRQINISFFNIIYKMTEWLQAEMEKRTPKIKIDIVTGRAKILRAFSRTKERQVVGGKVLEGHITINSAVKIMRREFEIGRGKIINLEKSKAKTSEVEEGSEFGMMIESKIEIAEGDTIESFSVTQK